MLWSILTVIVIMSFINKVTGHIEAETAERHRRRMRGE